MRGLETRVARLEERLGPDPSDPFGLATLTYEQLTIGHLDTCREILRYDGVGLPDDARAECKRAIAEIEKGIRDTAAGWANPQYAEHWRWVLRIWNGSCLAAAGAFVVPVYGPEWWSTKTDADLAAEMRWRTEIRRRPDIAALIAEGEAQAARRAGSIQ